AEWAPLDTSAVGVLRAAHGAGHAGVVLAPLVDRAVVVAQARHAPLRFDVAARRFGGGAVVVPGAGPQNGHAPVVPVARAIAAAIGVAEAGDAHLVSRMAARHADAAGAIAIGGAGGERVPALAVA